VTFSVLLSPSTIEHDDDDHDDDGTGNGHLPQAFLQKSKCQTNMTTFIHLFIHYFFPSYFHALLISVF
jgi:hypothetical protein